MSHAIHGKDDGRSDIVWRTTTASSDSFVIWYGAVRTDPIVGPGGDFKVAAVGDFDGDGQSDLYFLSSANHAVIWYSAGTGGRTLDVGTLDPSWTVIAAGNFTTDPTRTDLYVHTSLNQLLVLPGGLPANAQVEAVLSDPTYRIVGVGSFDF